jgi:prevent-host-death family protein
MKSVGIRQAKAHLSALARAAAAGESTLITDYGKPIAVIAPVVEDSPHGEAAQASIESKRCGEATGFACGHLGGSG